MNCNRQISFQTRVWSDSPLLSWGATVYTLCARKYARWLNTRLGNNPARRFIVPILKKTAQNSFGFFSFSLNWVLSQKSKSRIYWINRSALVTQSISCFSTGTGWSPGWRGVWKEESGSTMVGPMGKHSPFLPREGSRKSRTLRSVRARLYTWEIQWLIY